MNLDVLVRLRDSLTGGLRRMTGSLQAFGKMARNIGLVGTAIAAISFMGPIKEAAAFQQTLIDIAGTANLTGPAAYKFVDDLKLKYEGLALAVAQTSETIAGGAGQMIAAGVDPKLIDASIGNIGRAATAANAEFNDMASVATSMLTTLQLPADQLNDAIGGLVVSGKEGAFELKDMAKYFPTLTSQMTKFGIKGREAVNFLGAGLQIARKGTADPAEAANNLKNFLAKILAPATIKNFKDAGVNIEAVMRDAATKGINPIEAVMQKIVKLTGVSGTEIAGLMKKAKDGGLEGADALAQVREQLVKIHGAGALGDLFADMQVMDFLIPFLGNIDEYKRIKDEVGKATGAVIDGDFETQMDGLNRQLVTFGEIGTQASREVGFAFGTWLPVINENLSAALKWMRELDASTGGMVRQGIAMAGAGVLLAAGLGAVGVVLPIVGAGLSALLALLSPVGLALAAIGAGAAYVYQNWATFGPRVTALWDRAKIVFAGLADGVRNGAARIISVGRDLIAAYGPAIQRAFSRAWSAVKQGFSSFVGFFAGSGDKLAAAGREMVSRFGPTIVAGFNAAWADVKAGLANIQTFFEGFANGFKFKIDLSGLSFDSAKLAVFDQLDAALNRARIAWEIFSSVASGWAPHLKAIGENIGSTVNSVVRIASAFGRLGAALMQLVGVDTGKVGNFFKALGDIEGGAVDVITYTISSFADALASLVETAASLAEGKIDWSSLMPPALSEMWKDTSTWIAGLVTTVQQLPTQFYDAGLAAGQRLIDAMKAKLDELVAWFSGLGARILAAIGSIDISSVIKMPSWAPDWMGGGGNEPSAPPAPGAGPGPTEAAPPVPANSNKQSSLSPAQRGFAAPVKTASLNSTVNVVVKGVDGATIISSESDNPAVKVASSESDKPTVKVASTNTGRAVGRA